MVVSRRWLATRALAATACGAVEKKQDLDPPEFAGLATASAIAPGTALLTWDAAEDRSDPITYRVFVASSSGAESFGTAPLAETQSLEVQIAGFPLTETRYFVVRAADARGNEDANIVERAVTFVENRLTLLGDYETPRASDIAVHASNDLIAMGAFTINPPDPQVRAWLFDVGDPADPQLIATILGEGRSTDVEIDGDVLWVATEFDPDDHGAYSYDISDPANPVPLGFLSGIGLGSCHTLWIHGTLLYCASSDDGSMRIVDITDPANPVPRGIMPVPGGRIHDMYVDDDVAVGCFLGLGWAFLDVSDPDAPVLGPFIEYTGRATHNAWPSADKQFLFTTDETFNGRLRIWDISNRATPVQVGDFVADPGDPVHAIVHNVRVEGDLAYVGWYEAGVVVLDVSTPALPVLVGWHDTYEPDTIGTYAGAWSAAPKGDKVYVSDFTKGLFVLQLDQE